MKTKVILASALLALATFATAGETTAAPPTTNGVQQQQQRTETVSNSGASNQGVSQSIVFTAPAETSTTARVYSEVSGTQTIKNVPSVSGPPLVSSNDTCMGSTSFGINGPGFGVGGGSTWTDNNCVMLKNAREMWNYGYRAGAIARLCYDDLNKESMELTGAICPQTKKANSVQAPAPVRDVVGSDGSRGYTGTDPVVRRRLGLPAL